ncbi:MAG: hypothetical protein II830_01915 [Alphaproteobacteria bacterium]|nr:hypothetical protein [Alphaproteobacteria bacterium]
MQMYKDYKSPLGYEVGEDGIDSYGVNHNGFSTRDELEYQMARQNREQQLIQNYNSQGITENYPQYTTNFWGNNAYDNYGFGNSDISGNVQNVTNKLNGTDYSVLPDYSIGSANSYNNTGWYNNVSGYNNLPNYGVMPDYTISPNNDIETNNTTGLQPKRTVYQSLSGFAPDNQRWYENNPQKDSFNYVQDNYETNKLINDCLKSDRFRQFVSNIKQPEREGYGFHISDQPTNSGISQGLYDRFLQKYPKIAKVYPSKVKNLTQEQVDNVYCQEFYKPNHIETFNDNHTAEHIFDIGVNIGGPEGTKIVQNAYNDINAQNIGIDGKFGTETVSAINQLQNDDLLRLNNQIVNRRYKYYDSIKDKDKYPGWYTRAKSFRY